MERTTGYYNTFVVKIWHDQGTTRGHVQHVATKEYTYFLSADKMLDFVMSRSGPRASDSDIPDKMQSSRLPVSDGWVDFVSDE